MIYRTRGRLRRVDNAIVARGRRSGGRQGIALCASVSDPAISKPPTWAGVVCERCSSFGIFQAFNLDAQLSLEISLLICRIGFASGILPPTPSSHTVNLE